MLDRYPKARKYVQYTSAVLLAFNLCLSLFLFSTYRRVPKIAYFDAQKVLISLMLDVQEKNLDLVKTRLSTLQAKREIYEQKKSDFEMKKGRIKSEKSKKIAKRLEAEDEALREEAEQINLACNNGITKDLQERIPEILKTAEVAYKSHGYDIIVYQPMPSLLEMKQGSWRPQKIVMGDPKHDLTNDIIDRLGLKEVDVNRFVR